MMLTGAAGEVGLDGGSEDWVWTVAVKGGNGGKCLRVKPKKWGMGLAVRIEVWR